MHALTLEVDTLQGTDGYGVEAPPLAPDCTEEVELPAVGAEVIIHSLRSRASFNDSRGHVTRHCKDGMHVEVQVQQSGEKLRLRPGNIAVMVVESAIHQFASSPAELSRPCDVLTSAYAIGSMKADAFTMASNCVAEIREVASRMKVSWQSAQGAREHVKCILKSQNGREQRLSLDDLEQAEYGIQCLCKWARELDTGSLVAGSECKAAPEAQAASQPAGMGRRSRSSTRLRDEVARATDVSSPAGGTASLMSSPSSLKMSPSSKLQDALVKPADPDSRDLSKELEQTNGIGVVGEVQADVGGTCTTQENQAQTARQDHERAQKLLEQQAEDRAKLEAVEAQVRQAEVLNELVAHARELTVDFSKAGEAEVASQRALSTSTVGRLLALKSFAELRGLRIHFGRSPDLANFDQIGDAFSGLAVLDNLTVDLGECFRLSSVAGLGENLSRLTGLTSLTLCLNSCKSLPAVGELGRALKFLTSLRLLSLDLSDCPSLLSVDELGTGISFLRNLKALTVDLNGCEKILDVDEIGHALPQLEALENLDLDLSCCAALSSSEALRKGLDDCDALQKVTLNLLGCTLLPSSERKRMSCWDELSDFIRPPQLEKNKPKVEVLEEHMDDEYEPTDAEVDEYADWLGMDLEQDRDLLWIARKGLKEPVPKPWKPCRSGEDIFYFNFSTGETVWDHPCDVIFRNLYNECKNKRGADALSETTVSSMVESAIGKVLNEVSKAQSPALGEAVAEIDQAKAATPVAPAAPTAPKAPTAPTAPTAPQTPTSAATQAPGLPNQAQKQAPGGTVGLHGRRYAVAFPKRG